MHTSKRRLTAAGVEQAQRAGEWIRKDMLERARIFDHGDVYDNTQFFMSPYVRTMETALELGLSVQWRPDARLCERNWGTVDNLTYDEHMKLFKELLARRESDALFWTPRDGESILQVVMRLRQFSDMLVRQCGQSHVYISTHGEVIWGLRSLYEYWMPDELADRMASEDKEPQNKIFNCRVIQYSRQIHNDSPELDDHICRVRMINTQKPDDPKSNLDWQPVRRREFDPEQLRAYVDRFKHFLREPV